MCRDVGSATALKAADSPAAGVVVCPQTPAATVGADVLREGGNAVDAACASALAQGVVDPFNCGLGGGGVMLVHSAASGESEVIEFFPRAGNAVRPDQWVDEIVRPADDGFRFVLRNWVNECGYQSVGVPGFVAGIAEALRRHGTISWRDAIAPAAALAERGIRVTPHVLAYWEDEGPDYPAGSRRILATSESARLFARAGRRPNLGDVLPSPDLAETYSVLGSEGPDAFYTGSIGHAIAADFQANGGFIDESDLGECRAEVTSPVTGTYRGRQITTVGPPAGGVMLLQMLNWAEATPFGADTGWPSREASLRRVGALGWSVSERDEWLGDPRFLSVPVDQLISKQHARSAAASANPVTYDSRHTTHLSVLSGSGDAVAVTHTLGTLSGVVVPGLGFPFNNYLCGFDPRPGRANSLAPGKTRVTHMAPTFVMGDDRVEIAIGAPGAAQITSAIFQVLLNMIDLGMTPLEAVTAPRLHFHGNAVELEARMPSEVSSALEAAGYSVSVRPRAYDAYFAQPQVAAITASGELVGASDPRGDGGTGISVGSGR
jgi:gamma-glutamyltranspeptidase / glutathione hydrolase